MSIMKVFGWVKVMWGDVETWVDKIDLKSIGRNSVRVQIPLPLPKKEKRMRRKVNIINSDITSEAIYNAIDVRNLESRENIRRNIISGFLNGLSVADLHDMYPMSRQGIYDLIDKVNAKGMDGFNNSKRGRPPFNTQVENIDESEK
jgi:hypothetical protein